MKKPLCFALLISAAALGAAGCSTAPKTEAARDALSDDAQKTVQKLERDDPSMETFLNAAYGYVVFPSAGKGGLGIGAAYGHGLVYEQGQVVGYADISQASIGLQIGGQEFTEVIAFENKAALDNFKENKVHFEAEATAVALKSGAGTAAKYTDGVALFIKPKAGLMAGATIGGQRFTYKAK